MRALLSVYLKGVCMGAADAVPGVSGGTIALITGIYERLVSAIAAVDPRIVTSLLRAYDPDERAKVREMLVEMDLPFLLPLGAGILTAIVSVTRAMLWAYENHPTVLFGFFFGLIAASAVVLYDEVRVDTPPRIAAAVAGFALAFVVAGATESGGGAPPSLPFVFFAGSLAICAMILPGISGAFILYLLGEYEYMTDTLHSFLGELADVANGGDVAALVEPATVVVVFVLGAVVGLLTVAKGVSWALGHYRAVTLTFLVSLMVGSLRLPVKEVLAEATWAPEQTAAILVATLVGGGAVLLLDYYTDDLDF